MNDLQDADFPPNLPGNSIKKRMEHPNEPVPPPPPPKDIKKVITGKVVRKKKPMIDRFAETFFGDDAGSVLNYVIYDVLIPAAKTTFLDMLNRGGERLLYGEDAPVDRSKLRRNKGVTRVSYENYWDKDEKRNHRSSRPRRNIGFADIILESHSEAEDVLVSLVDMVDKYGEASVADLYALIDEPASYTDNKFGWDNLSEALIKPVRGGYALHLPDPIDI